MARRGNLLREKNSQESSQENSNEYMMVSNHDDLDYMISRIGDSDRLFIDTEFHRERTYFPLLCLLQIEHRGEIFLVDALSDDLDNQEVFDWMFSQERELVLHACDQDVEVLEHASNHKVSCVFDTQLAASFLGFGDQVSLSQLILDAGGPRLKKGSQVSNWRARPLSKAQCLYAASDVAYLKLVYDQLCELLEKENRVSWFASEMENKLRAAQQSQTYVDLAKRIKIRETSPDAKHQLFNLVAWREELAKKNDLPRRWVMSDQMIAELAQSELSAPEDFRNLRFFAVNKRMNITEDAVIKRLQRNAEFAQAKNDVSGSARRRSSSADADKVSLLKLLLKFCARDAGIAPHLVANEKDLQQFVQDPDSSPLCSGWRADIFGRRAALAISGKVCLRLAGDKLEFIETDSNEKNAGNKPKNNVITNANNKRR